MQNSLRHSARVFILAEFQPTLRSADSALSNDRVSVTNTFGQLSGSSKGEMDGVSIDYEEFFNMRTFFIQHELIPLVSG